MRCVTGPVLVCGLVLMVCGVPAMGAKTPPPLPDPPPDAVYVNYPWELSTAMANLTSGQTIVLNPGVYDLGTYAHTYGVTGKTDITIRGATNDPNDVVLIGSGMNTTGSTPIIFQMSTCSNVLIANMTLRDVYHHLIQLQGDVEYFHIYNCRLIDCRTQFMKVQLGSDDGLVEYCRFEFTDRAVDDYTHAIDCINYCNRWVIRDNTFLRMRGPLNQRAGAAILMWCGCEDSLVERNEFIECDMGIQFGNPSGHPDGDHIRGIIRNNFFYRAPAGAGPTSLLDVAISLNYCLGAKVYNNTIIYNQTFDWLIEGRYSITTADVYNNITDDDDNAYFPPIYERDGGTLNQVANLTDAGSTPEWFVGFESGDLHLTAAATDAIDQAVSVPEVTDDFDGDARPVGDGPDIGADEFTGPSPLPGQASSPSPANGATKVSRSAILSWTAGSGADSHDVYFGTDPNPGASEFQGNQTETTFDPGYLGKNTWYYWRIDEVNTNGTTTGVVWSFKTGAR